MKETLNWIHNEQFLDKITWAPFVISKDIDYYDDLCNKYNSLIKNLNAVGADEQSLKIVTKYTNKIREAIRKHYAGYLSTSHIIIKNLLRGVLDNRLAVNNINDSKAFPGTGREIQFFRARLSEKAITFSPKDMLHIPFDQRGKTGNYRFSIPGIPSLYLGNSTYACWLELGCPADYKFNVSPVLLDGTQRILNLAVMTRNLLYLDEGNISRVHCWLKLIVLMIATSYIIEEEKRTFKSEYIVSQSIMLGCKELKLDGIAYFSKRVDDEVFANSAVNLALFTNYKKGQRYSEICKHIKVGDSYNYSLYKQLGDTNKKVKYDNYRIRRTGMIMNIGTYNRQFSYYDTDFCSFDKFLFATWNEKNNINFGNAFS